MAIDKRTMKRLPKKLTITIEYVVDPEYFNAEDILDKLRETGEAEIVDITVSERTSLD